MTSEGIRIAAGKISISGSCEFSSGYDPTTKVVQGGAASDVNSYSTTINGDKIRSGTIESNNWGASAGSQYGLNAGTIKIGGYTLPKFEFDGSNLYVRGGTITGGSADFGVSGQGHVLINPPAYLYSFLVQDPSTQLVCWIRNYGDSSDGVYLNDHDIVSCGGLSTTDSSVVQIGNYGIIIPQSPGTSDCGNATNYWSHVYSSWGNFGYCSAYYFNAQSSWGVNGSFTSGTGGTITVTGGIITSIT